VRLVRAQGGRLTDGVRPLSFVLVNAYYLQEEAARGRSDVVDETLAGAGRLGARVVRTWAFNDDPAKQDSALQRARLDYHEAAFAGLDRVLAGARAHGLRLILPLLNYWNAYGGVRQWLAWNGVGDALEGDTRFFSDERLRAHYAAHVERLLVRRNPLTGLRYGEDPVVLAWELMNEPRGAPALVADWARFAVGAVKRHARQLVSLGDEGGLVCDGLDLISCHYYPEKWGIRPSGCAYIRRHAARARRAGRPLYVGELGTLADRGPRYRRWFAAAQAGGVAGIGPWLFCYRTRPAEWDEYSFYADGEEARAVSASAAPPPHRYRTAMRTATP
jgi:mannan endo-1,4-beta-mannosidase